MTDPWDEWFIYLPWKPMILSTIHGSVFTYFVLHGWVLGPGPHEENLLIKVDRICHCPMSHGSEIRFPAFHPNSTRCGMAWLHHLSGFNHAEVKRFFFLVSIDWKGWLREAFGELKFLGGEIVNIFLHSNYDCIKLDGIKLCYMFLYSIVFYYK